MRRYWVEPEYFFQDRIELRGEDFKHICVVCRQEVGDRFEVIVSGKAYFVEIEEMSTKMAQARVLEQRTLPPLKKPWIHLALSLPKFQTVDKVIEKMVELGVCQVHLFSSDFSFMKPKAGELDKRYRRWEKIIQGATQQTGRGERMPLTEVQPLDVLLAGDYLSSPNRWGVLAYEGEGGHGLGHQLGDLPEATENIWIFVGPEGGFSSADIKLFSDYKLLPVSLGDQVLRVETACVTLVSVLKYALNHYD